MTHLSSPRRIAGRIKSLAKRNELTYQEKLAYALHQRVEMIEELLGDCPACSILDLGCNRGDISAEMAKAGHWVIGLDSSSDLIKEAIRRHEGAERCAFMVETVLPGNVGSLPRVDVALLLSVHHHWLKQYGPDEAGKMLATVIQRTRVVVVFEGASRRERYHPFLPDFVDNDLSSIDKYFMSYFEQHVGQVIAEVRRLGPIPCVGDREPFRLNYALFPNPQTVAR